MKKITGLIADDHKLCSRVMLKREHPLYLEMQVQLGQHEGMTKGFVVAVNVLLGGIILLLWRI